MQLPIYTQNAENVGTIEVSDAIFALPMNQDLLHQVIVSQSANRRQVIAHAKGRSEVRGGGRKPWRQKGTGRARHGSIRSPLWRGGGATFGPTKEKDYSKKINRKMARKALGVALSSKIRDGQFVVVDALNIEEPKTRLASKIMRTISGLFFPTLQSGSRPSGVGTGKAKKMLLVVPTMENTALTKSVRNLPNVEIMEARNLNSLDILTFPNVVALKDAVQAIEKTFSKK